MNVRFLMLDEIKPCNDFHNKFHGTNRTEAQWKWEFLANNSRQIPFAVVEEEGRILGTQALIPIRMIDEAGEFLSAKSEETLVDPVLRGKDMFSRMYDLLFEHAEQHNILTIWGFTSAQKPFERVGFKIPDRTSQLFFPFSSESIKLLLKDGTTESGQGVFRRLKYQGLGLAVALAGTISLASLKIANLRLRFRNLRDIRIETLSEPPQGAGELCRQFVKQWGGTTILRDEDYLRWRFFQNPYVRATVRAAYIEGKLVGWVAYSVDDESMGYIIDIFAASNVIDRSGLETVLALLLGDMVVRLRKTGALGVRGWSVNKHPFDLTVTRVARSMGFFPIRRGEPMVIWHSNNASSRTSLGSFDKWYINRIYTEGVSG